MTLTGGETGFSPTVGMNDAQALTWGDVADRLRSLRKLGLPMAMRIEARDAQPITIHVAADAYHWADDAGNTPLPEGPLQVRVRTLGLADRPLEVRTGTLGALLWRIGMVAFAHSAASWMVPGERYRMVAWPNLTEVDATTEQVQLCALFGSAALDLDDVAGAVGVDRQVAVTLVSTLSLTGSIEPDPTAPVRKLKGGFGSGPRSLFRMIRERFGA